MAILEFIFGLLGRALRRLFAPRPKRKTGPDNYPGDTAFTAILQKIYHGEDGKSGIANDKIHLSGYPHPTRPDKTWTRSEIVKILLHRYGQGGIAFADPKVAAKAGGPAAGTGTKTCYEHLWKTRFTEAACVASLTAPKGYAGPGGWDAWAGSHSGKWYGDEKDKDGNQVYEDDAKWKPAEKTGLHPVPPVLPVPIPGQPTPPSTPPIVLPPAPYDFQPVDFLDRNGRVERRGWNQSHPAVDYVWGWDPKNEGEHDGRIGAHIGFPHSEGGAEGIFWFTCREVFFEAIKRNDERRRISVGLWGKGMWTVT